MPQQPLHGLGAMAAPLTAQHLRIDYQHLRIDYQQHLRIDYQQHQD
jgi:hypothetical protein